MAKYVVTLSSIQNIANAIREKNGTNNTYKPAQMASAIRDIPVSSSPDFWFGTRQEYNSLNSYSPSVCYCIEEGS